MTYKCRTYYTNNQVKCKTTMLKPSLYDYCNGYALVKRTITVPSK